VAAARPVKVRRLLGTVPNGTLLRPRCDEWREARRLMAHAAAMKAAAALWPPPNFSPPSSAGLLPRARDVCRRVIGAASGRQTCGRSRAPSTRRDFHDARTAFDQISKRSAPAWTAAISACARAGRHADGMRVFAEMLADGATVPNAFALAGCSGAARGSATWTPAGASTGGR
jgi:pentatricopeptide repeat protein